MNRGPYIQTLTGGAWYPFDPRAGEVRFADLRTLARINRFGGHTLCDGYSVAEHSIRVARLLDSWGASLLVCLAGLLHDAHEIYPPGDQLGPVLRAMRQPEACAVLGLPPGAFDGLLEMERRAKAVTREAFGVAHWFTPGSVTAAQIKQADLTLLATERRDLMAEDSGDWGSLPDALPRPIVPWSPARAWEMFKIEFYKFSAMCAASAPSP